MKRLSVSKAKQYYGYKLNKFVIDAISNIEKEKGLTPENVVKEASKITSPLHRFFEWNDKSASHEWRLHQARVLINQIKIIVDEKVISAYENVSIKIDEESTRHIYKPIQEVISNAELRKQLIKGALSQIKTWTEKYKIYSELKPIVITAEAVSKQLEKKWSKKKR